MPVTTAVTETETLSLLVYDADFVTLAEGGDVETEAVTDHDGL